MKSKLIAPCGMNCNLCKAYLRDKDKCPGCRDMPKGHYVRKCMIRNCKILKKQKLKFCSDKCEKFPCTRLKNLDKRYRKKYGMSMIDNLNYIKEKGIRNFIKEEKQKWTIDKKTFCVHDKKYY